jgi:prophage antirepressor-like protein
MDIFRAFNLNDEEHIINIQGTVEDPLFQANQVCDLLGIKSFRSSIIDFTDEHKVLLKVKTAGGLQDVIFFTELGLYKLLGRSRKEIASQFQNWIIKVIKEIRITGIYKLNENNEIDKKLLESNYNLINNKTFIKAFHNKNVIYICKFTSIDDKYVIKIGSTQNIKERIYNLNNQFQNIEPVILDIIEVNNYRKYEKYLHNHQYIKQYYYKFEKKDGTISNETYLTTEDEYNYIINILNEDKKKFDIDTMELEELRLKIEEKKSDNNSIELKINELKLKQKKLDAEIKKNELEIKKIELEKINKEKQDSTDESSSDDSDDIESYEDSENEEDNLSYNFEIKKQKNSIRVPKVYQYDTNDLKNPIKIYDSPKELIRSNNDIFMSSLKNACKKNTIYKNYRWIFVNRNDEPPEEIPETVVNNYKSPYVKYLAMIDIKKTKILNVFSTQKEACAERNMKANGFTRAIKQYSISSGHYWKFFEDCPIEMQNEYLLHNKLPEKYVSSYSKIVSQICPKTNKIINTYNSKNEVVNKFQMSMLTLKNCSTNGNIYNGYRWKINE